jgi:Na+/H+-translocating membrane pyrophosphatase
MAAREYGLWAVCIGLVVLGVLDTVVLLMFHHDAQQALALIGAVDSPVAVMVSAYFGMKIGSDAGSAGTAAAERGRDQANARALAFAAHLPPGMAGQALADLRSFGIDVPPGPAPTPTGAEPQPAAPTAKPGSSSAPPVPA